MLLLLLFTLGLAEEDEEEEEAAAASLFLLSLPSGRHECAQVNVLQEMAEGNQRNLSLVHLKRP